MERSKGQVPTLLAIDKFKDSMQMEMQTRMLMQIIQFMGLSLDLVKPYHTSKSDCRLP